MGIKTLTTDQESLVNHTVYMIKDAIDKTEEKELDPYIEGMLTAIWFIAQRLEDDVEEYDYPTISPSTAE